MERARLKQRITNMFRASLRSSCSMISSRNVTDAVQEPVFVSRRYEDDFQKLDRSLSLPPYSQQDRLLRHHQVMAAPSRLSVDCGVCRPTTATTKTRGVPKKSKNKERRVSEIGSLYQTGGHGEGPKCPPASPVSPSYHYFKQMREELAREEKRITCSIKKKKKKEEKLKKKKKLLSNSYGFTSSPSEDTDDDDGDFFSSDESGGLRRPRERRLLKERKGEAEALFSSRSFSSDSSEFYYHSSTHHPNNRKKFSRRRPQQRKPRRRDGGQSRYYDWDVDGLRSMVSIAPSSPSSTTRSTGEEEAEVAVGEEGREGFAVVKQSCDPYADFRSSMLEMILEKQMFGEKDLEHLLRCYLSLNSPRHHRIIVEVFSEIREALFGN